VERGAQKARLGLIQKALGGVFEACLAEPAMKYNIEIRPSVEKALRKIRDRQLQQRLDAAFEKLSENPRRPGVEKMSGVENRYRFRVGDYRVIFEIHDKVLLVLILAVGDRKDIYR
jgi:mRNA interferase RelE/StbE